MENKTPKISVIIPVYNVEEYLEKCLESVLEQTFSDIEIICINDGSTDSSLDILNEYCSNDDRFTIVVQGNKGPSVARNEGIKLAKGDYIAFIDSDDYLLNNDYFEKLYNACEKYNADIAVASIIRGNDKKSKYILKIEKEEIATDYKNKLLLCDVPASNYVCNKLYKRESLLASGLIFPPGRIYEDIYFTSRVLYCMQKLVSVPGVAYFYRKRKNSIVKTVSTKAKKDKLIAQNEMKQFLKNHDISIEDLDGYIKKYKLGCITILKTVRRKHMCIYTLFNLIRWSIKN